MHTSFIFLAILFSFFRVVPATQHDHHAMLLRAAHHKRAIANVSTSPNSRALPPNSDLFPLGTPGKSWSTCSCTLKPLPRPLSDDTFRPKNDMKSLPHNYTKAPDGKNAMRIFYPNGSVSLHSIPLGGISFYAPGPPDVDMTTAKEITFGYRVFFDKGFAYRQGGKLPGVYGGNSDDEALTCSDGRKDDSCFSARLMWRTDGAGELYTYLPPSFKNNDRVCNVKPYSECNPDYGASIGRGSFKFPSGKWTTVSERVKLNDVGKDNGELELFVGGMSVINVDGLTLRNSATGRIRGLQVQSFFGGHEESWASPKNQSSYFTDFSVAIIRTL